MELFVEISQHLQGVDDATDLPPFDYWKTSSAINFQMWFHCLGSRQGRQTKLQKYKLMVDNIFFSEAFQASVIKLFCRTQRCYHAFSRFALCWKVKHAKRIVDHDLNLEPIDLAKPRHYLTLFQGKATYHFKLQDMVQLVETALSHSHEFFVKPLMPRNPYTNQPFTLAMLVCIYERIRTSGFRMPVLLELFFRSAGCNIAKFAFQHEGVIRECHIERLVKYGDVEVLTYHIRHMLRYVQVFPHLDVRFPKATLVNIFRPYLALYMCHIFSTIYGEKKDRAYCELYRKLHKLMDFNPLLGRAQLIPKVHIEAHKFLVLASPYNEATPFLEVFSINVLPFDDDEEQDTDEEEEEEEVEEDY